MLFAILEVAIVTSNTKLKKMGFPTLQSFLNLKNEFLGEKICWRGSPHRISKFKRCISAN